MIQYKLKDAQSSSSNCSAKKPCCDDTFEPPEAPLSQLPGPHLLPIVDMSPGVPELASGQSFQGKNIDFPSMVSQGKWKMIRFQRKVSKVPGTDAKILPRQIHNGMKIGVRISFTNLVIHVSFRKSHTVLHPSTARKTWKVVSELLSCGMP